jgi:hypothetical protein
MAVTPGPAWQPPEVRQVGGHLAQVRRHLGCLGHEAAYARLAAMTIWPAAGGVPLASAQLPAVRLLCPSLPIHASMCITIQAPKQHGHWLTGPIVSDIATKYCHLQDS